MISYLKNILLKIEAINPEHADKLNKSNNASDENYSAMANRFFGKYDNYLQKINRAIDFGVDCYLHMHSDMLQERIKFIQSGKYSSVSFDEVEKRVYGNTEIMTYHMHGLVLAQFLWFEQYERIKFFYSNLNKYAPACKKYLEIGGGHGLYMNEALRLLNTAEQFDLVDISNSSLELAKGIINNSKVNYHFKNIFDFPDDTVYNFVTMGEVLEHVEEPLSLLQKVSKLIGADGTAFITTPINAPMIDHIYLFKNAAEIRDIFKAAGLEIAEEKIVISEQITEKKAEKFKVPVMFAAFVKNKK